MKSLLLAFALFATTFVAKAETEPTLVLEVHFTTQTENQVINRYLEDSDFCCIFEIVGSQSTTQQSYTEIRHKETGVLLGTFYGTPTKEFVLKIYREQLTKEYIDNVVPKLVGLSNSQ